MDHSYWRRQSAGKPLFEDITWSRPENRQTRGKLLIIGGNLHGFSAPSEAYREAERAGGGAIRVMLPDSIHKLVGGFFENALFAPCTKSGSFALSALTEWQEESSWADAILLAGDLGRNSETAILIEKFLATFRGSLVLSKDAVDYLQKDPQAIADREDTTLVLGLAQLQKLGVGLKLSQPITFSMDFLKLVEALHELTERTKLEIITKHGDNLFVAAGGQVSTTKLSEELEIWRVKTAAHAAVWRLQNPTKPFEALTTSLI